MRPLRGETGTTADGRDSIGRTIQKLGRPEEAIAYYEHYLALDARQSNPAWQAKAREYLQQARREIESRGGDKRRGPAAPLPGLPPGIARPAPGTPGLGPLAAADEEPPPAPLLVEEEPEPPPAPLLAEADPVPANPKAGPDSGSGPELAATPLPPEPGTPPAVSPRPRLPVGFWVGLGLTGGMLVAATVTGALALRASGTLQHTPYAGLSPTEAVLAEQARVRGLAISTDVLLGAAAVTLGATLIGTFAGRKAAPARAARVGLYTGSGAAVLGGRF